MLCFFLLGAIVCRLWCLWSCEVPSALREFRTMQSGVKWLRNKTVTQNQTCCTEKLWCLEQFRVYLEWARLQISLELEQVDLKESNRYKSLQLLCYSKGSFVLSPYKEKQQIGANLQGNNSFECFKMILHGIQNILNSVVLSFKVFVKLLFHFLFEMYQTGRILPRWLDMNLCLMIKLYFYF